MFYIFNADHVCIGSCGSEPDQDDLNSRGEYATELSGECRLGDALIDGVIVPKVVPVDHAAMARNLRNGLRNSIDTYLMPAATINDVLVTDEQKQTLIADSLLLAAWPATAGWPFVPLPALSPLLHSLITVPAWDYQ